MTSNNHYNVHILQSECYYGMINGITNCLPTPQIRGTYSWFYYSPQYVLLFPRMFNYYQRLPPILCTMTVHHSQGCHCHRPRHYGWTPHPHRWVSPSWIPRCLWDSPTSLSLMNRLFYHQTQIDSTSSLAHSRQNKADCTLPHYHQTPLYSTLHATISHQTQLNNELSTPLSYWTQFGKKIPPALYHQPQSDHTLPPTLSQQPHLDHTVPLSHCQQSQFHSTLPPALYHQNQFHSTLTQAPFHQIQSDHTLPPSISQQILGSWHINSTTLSPNPVGSYTAHILFLPIPVSRHPASALLSPNPVS